MTKYITDISYLIIEDEEDKVDFLLRLLKEAGVSLENVFDAKTTREAIEKIDEIEPEVVLLDIAMPMEVGGEPNAENCQYVIEKIKNINHENLDRKVKTIIISATVDNTGIQKLIKGHEVVFTFMDKNLISIDPDKFKSDLLKNIERAINKVEERNLIDYSFVRNAIFKDLKKIDLQLWEKIQSEVLEKFERLNDRNRNHFTLSRDIIKTCGEIVEKIIAKLISECEEIGEKPSEYDLENRRNKLVWLSGRRFKGNHTYEVIKEPFIISRKSCAFAHQAWSYRGDAAHSREEDPNNTNIFKGTNFSIEDAAISIQLILPLIQDYIAFKKR